MNSTKKEKKKLIIYIAVAYGITYLMGLLMWYGSSKGYDVTTFPLAQMMYPATGVMLALLITNKGSSRKDGRALQAEELLKCYSDKISEESKEIIGIVANYKKSIWAQMKLLFDSRYTMGRLSNDFWMKLRILLRKL